MTKLLDYRGEEMTLPARARTERAGAVPVNEQAAVASMVVTNPTQLRTAWQAADRGDLSALMQICEQVENDPDVGSAIRTRRLTVSQLPWRVIPGDAEDERSREIGQDVEEMLKRVDLRTAIEHLQGAILQPFAVLEIVWQNRERTTVEALVPRLGKEFRIDYAESGEQLRLLTDRERYRGEAIDPAKFIVYASREKSRSLITKGGLIRGAAGIWLIKWHALRNWAIFSEVFGIPWRIGKYDVGTSDEMIAKLKSAVRSLGIDAGAVISRDMEIQIVESVKNSGQAVFGPFIQLLNAEIAKQILGQVLTSAGSDQGAGSLALGQVHNEVRQDLRKADAANIANVINQQLVKLYVIFNYGEQASYPTLEILADPTEDLKARLEIDDRLVRLGLPLTKEYFYATYDRPAPAEGETVVTLPAGPATGPFGFGARRIQDRGQRPFAHPLERRGA